MEKTKQPYYCFQCGKPMENLPTLLKDSLSSILTDRFGCKTCNFVQEKNHLARRLSPNDYELNYEQYKEKLEEIEK